MLYFSSYFIVFILSLLLLWFLFLTFHFEYICSFLRAQCCTHLVFHCWFDSYLFCVFMYLPISYCRLLEHYNWIERAPTVQHIHSLTRDGKKSVCSPWEWWECCVLGNYGLFRKCLAVYFYTNYSVFFCSWCCCCCCCLYMLCSSWYASFKH